jgi:Tripartite tricarboxylate transporter TctB family
MSHDSAAPGHEAGRRPRGGPSAPDLLAGGTFLGLGLAFVIGGRGYEVGSALRMGPGYVPVLLGGILALLGAIIVATAFYGGDPHLRELEQERGPVPWVRGGLLVAAILFFGLTVRGLGLAPSLFVTTWLAALAGHRTGPVRAAVISAGLTAVSLLVFVVALQLRLPLLGEWLEG